MTQASAAKLAHKSSTTKLEEEFASARKLLTDIAAHEKAANEAKLLLHRLRGSFVREEKVSDLFGLPSEATLEKSILPCIYPTKRIDDYVFRPKLMRDIMNFWGLGRRAAMLCGDKGAGKTSIVEQFHNRLNANLLQMTGHGRTTYEDLFGQLVPTESGGLKWLDGPVTKAAREGMSVLINEFNALPSDLQIALNDVAHEGTVLALPGNGEQFMPQTGFRLFCTINPKGDNDHMYHGRKDTDSSTKERFFWIRVDYGSYDEELQIVKDAWARQNGDVTEAEVTWCRAIVDTALKVRSLNKVTGPTHIPELISTRVMVNWAIYWVLYHKQPDAMHIGLLRAFTFACSPAVALKIHDVVKEFTQKEFDRTMIGLDPVAP